MCSSHASSDLNPGCVGMSSPMASDAASPSGDEDMSRSRRSTVCRNPIGGSFVLHILVLLPGSAMGLTRPAIVTKCLPCSARRFLLFRSRRSAIWEILDRRQSWNIPFSRNSSRLPLKNSV